MRKTYTYIVLILCWLCLIFTGCVKKPQEESSIVEMETPIELTVGDNYMIAFDSDTQEKLSVVANNENVSLTVLGKSINVMAVKGGDTELEIKDSKRTEIWRFHIEESIVSAQKNGLSISCPPLIKTVLGITTPIQLNPVVFFDGEKVETPIIYEIADSNICTLNEMGKLTPKSVGVTSITLKTSYNNATTQKSFAVFVYSNADIIFEKTQINLFLKGESTTKLQFELFIGDSTIAENDLSSITYSVKDPTICEINANAEITAKSFGETSVVVNYNGFEAGVSVSVYNEEVLVSSIEDLKGVQDGNYYRFVEDINYNFEAPEGAAAFENGCIVDELNATIDGDGHKISISATSGNFTSVHAYHKHNFNFVRVIGEKGVVKNISIDYALSPQSNVYEGTFAFGENNGIVENVIYSINYNGWFVVDGAYVSYFSSGGTGVFRNVIAYITHTGWQNNTEIYTSCYHLTDGLIKLENVLIIGGALIKMPSSGNNVAKIASADKLSNSGFTMLDFDCGGKESVWEEGNSGVPVFKLGVINIYDAQDLLENKNQNAHFNLMNDIFVELDQSKGERLIETLNGTFEGNGHTITIKIIGETITPIHDAYLNLIHNVTANGVLRNLKVIYDYTMTADVNYASLLVDNNDGVIENIEMDVSFSLYYVNRGFGYVSRTGTGTVRNLLLKITTGNNSWQFSSLDDGYGKFIVCNGSVVENVLVIYDGHTNLIIPKGNNISAIVSENDYKNSGFDASRLDSEQWLISNNLPRIGQGSFYQVTVMVCQEDGSYVDITDQLDETITQGAGVFGETIDLTNMAIGLRGENPILFDYAVDIEKSVLKGVVTKGETLVLEIVYKKIECVEVKSEAELLAAIAQGNVNIKLINNITVATSGTIIETLNVTLDLNGYTLTRSSTNAADMHLIKTITKNGVLKNGKIDFTYRPSAATGHLAYVINQNNGLVENVEVKATLHSGSDWNNLVGLFEGQDGGVGTYRNMVVQVSDEQIQNACGVFRQVNANLTVENCIIIKNSMPFAAFNSGWGMTEQTLSNLKSSNGTILFNTIAEYTASNYDTSSFSSDYWTIDATTKLPKIKAFVASNEVEVDSEANLLAAIAQGNVNIKLVSDITITTSGTIIETLNVTLDLNGHTLTRSSTNAADMHLIKTITENGVLKNGKIDFTYRPSAATGHLAYIINQNNGLVENVEVKATLHSGSDWNNLVGLFEGQDGGVGTYRNMVVQVSDEQIQNACGVFRQVNANLTVENCIIIKNNMPFAAFNPNWGMTEQTLSNLKSSNGTILFNTIAEYTASNYDTSSFSSDYWTIDEITKLPKIN